MFMEVPLLAGRGAAYKCSFLRLTLKDSRPAGPGVWLCYHPFGPKAKGVILMRSVPTHTLTALRTRHLNIFKAP